MTIGQSLHEFHVEEIYRRCMSEDLELIQSEENPYFFMIKDLDGFTVCEGSLSEIDAWFS